MVIAVLPGAEAGEGFAGSGGPESEGGIVAEQVAQAVAEAGVVGAAGPDACETGVIDGADGIGAEVDDGGRGGAAQFLQAGGEVQQHFGGDFGLVVELVAATEAVVPEHAVGGDGTPRGEILLEKLVEEGGRGGAGGLG